MSLRIVALDLDGTLLDPYGELSDGVCEAVDTLRKVGLQVVLCTGRRFRTALPMAHRLGLEGPIVVNNGVLVKDIESGKTLQHEFLPIELFSRALELMREHGPPLVYIDAYHEGTDMITERIESAHPFQQEYLADNTEFSQIVDDLTSARPSEVIMMSTMADEDSLEALESRARDALGAEVHTHRLINKSYQGYILEFLSPSSGKWSALRRLAASEGIDPEQIAAIGDDRNDVEMLREAGLGIAMGNAVEDARNVAGHVVRSNAEGGVVEAIERVLLTR
jgi:Cof subfamily protein (haloacid dehalogenase superfamily)